MPMEVRFQGNRPPSIVQLRSSLKQAIEKGETRVEFEWGEQYSTFERGHDGRWNHHGNGLMKAAYKLADEESNKPATPFRMR